MFSPNSLSKPSKSANSSESYSTPHHALFDNHPFSPVGFGFVGIFLVAPIARNLT